MKNNERKSNVILCDCWRDFCFFLLDKKFGNPPQHKQTGNLKIRLLKFVIQMFPKSVKNITKHSQTCFVAHACFLLLAALHAWRLCVLPQKELLQSTPTQVPEEKKLLQSTLWPAQICSATKFQSHTWCRMLRIPKTRWPARRWPESILEMFHHLYAR